MILLIALHMSLFQIPRFRGYTKVYETRRLKFKHVTLAPFTPAVPNVDTTVKYLALSNVHYQRRNRQILSHPEHTSAHSTALPNFVIQSGTGPISSNCMTLTAQAPQCGHVTIRL